MESAPRCDNCHLKNKKSVPVIWCPICNDILCSSCEQQHQMQRLSRDHATIPYEDYCKLPPFIRNVDLNCPEHNKTYQYFCRSHDVPCCVKCRSKFHKTCDVTPITDDIVRNVKSSAGFEAVWEELQAKHETYKDAIKTGENNLRKIETSKKEFVKRLKEKTNQLIEQLKTIETQTLFALDSVITGTADKIETPNKALRLEETKLKTMVCLKTSLTTHTSDYHVFIGIKHIENEIRKSTETLQKMVKDKCIK